MGQKVHATGFRLGDGKHEQHRSVWFAKSKLQYASNLLRDKKVRDFFKKELAKAHISKIHIARPKNAVVTLELARAGAAIGPKGEKIEKLRQQAAAILGIPTQITIKEIKRPELDAYLVAKSIAEQLEKRVQFRRCMKRAATNTMRIGAKGIKIAVSGRLGGAEIARREWMREGRVPLHTIRADIDYATHEAQTTYGIIGVKVWIFKGEVLKKNEAEQPAEK